MWVIAGTEIIWRDFSRLAQRVVRIYLSESEAEREISIQQDIAG
jgi:hypothetical protein